MANHGPGKYRVLRGTHTEESGTYYPGDEVDSKSDLDQFNSPGAQKFQWVGSGKHSTKDSKKKAQAADLETLNVPDLKKLAEEEGVDLGNSTRRDDIVDKIVEARG